MKIGDDAFEGRAILALIAIRRAMQQDALDRFPQCFERRLGIGTKLATELSDHASIEDVGSFPATTPGFDRTFGQRFFGVGDDEFGVEFEDGAQSAAG